jgi:hypothetical protein
MCSYEVSEEKVMLEWRGGECLLGSAVVVIDVMRENDEEMRRRLEFDCASFLAISHLFLIEVKCASKFKGKWKVRAFVKEGEWIE